ncbi:MAG: carboxypeptidase regulatory-like domain-containing protein [Candidatus Hydrogenedentes bacterium]|nr:carboxypeptidase regulatory-like domain-containing protein [Candidatus Hydrogenedentota bacterium]
MSKRLILLAAMGALLALLVALLSTQRGPTTPPHPRESTPPSLPDNTPVVETTQRPAPPPPATDPPQAPPPDPASLASVNGTLPDATIKGRVLFKGDAVGNAAIRVGANDENRPPLAYSDEMGRFEITGIPSGSIQLWASRPPFLPRVTVVQVRSGETAHVTITLQGSAALKGTVYFDDTPLPNAQVTASVTGQSANEVFETVTGPDGAYALDLLPPGEITVLLLTEGAGPDITGHAIRSMEQTLTVDPGVNSLLDFHFPRTSARLEGVISLAGTPHPGAEIEVALPTGMEPPSIGTMSDVDGSYAIDNLPPGPVTVTVRLDPGDPEGMQQDFSLELSVDTTTMLPVNFDPTVHIVGQASGYIETDSTIVSLLPGDLDIDPKTFDEAVALRTQEIANITLGADPRFRFDGIEPGHYKIALMSFRRNADAPTQYDSIASVWKELTLDTPGFYEVDLSLPP